MISGRATAEGTRRFAGRFQRAAPGHFRSVRDLTVSSLGLGTFPGGEDDATDAGYRTAIRRVLEMGCNVIDTSVAYRNQRSERVVGKTLRKLVSEGRILRDEVVLSSKAGFLPFDSDCRGGVAQYVEETFVKPGIVNADEIVGNGHCVAPAFLRHQIETSCRNLGCGTVDLYFVHNPETQLREIGRDEFRVRMLAAFETLEQAVDEGKIGGYGVATWSGFRVSPAARDYLSLSDLLQCATEVGGPSHHFRAIIVPFNLAMLDAFAFSNQEAERGSRRAPLLQVALDFGIAVSAGSSIDQARLARGLPAEIHAMDGALSTDAQRALQFARSAPGVTTALVGMSNPAHVEENLALVELPPLPEDRFQQLFDE
jgi:aryl-alcohol dehydrogenase-like predicted oxidoreductase